LVVNDIRGALATASTADMPRFSRCHYDKRLW
jgi:hypothetical protein